MGNMIGHQQIIRARLDGMKPAAVFIETQFKPGTTTFENPEKALDFDILPTVFIAENELRKRHDFRFLTNCQVHVSGASMTDDFLSLVEAIAVHTNHVIACADGDITIFRNGEWHAYANPEA